MSLKGLEKNHIAERAQVVQKYGKDWQLKLQPLSLGRLGGDEVLVRVCFASINPADIKTLTNQPAYAPPIGSAIGADFSGTVEAVGKHVKGFKPGDKVFGMSGGVVGRDGAFSSLIRVPKGEVVKLPPSVSLELAAAVPCAGLTAWYCLVTKAHAQPGQKILIHGANGGVGHIALQLANMLELEVYASVSSVERANLIKKFSPEKIFIGTAEQLSQTTKDERWAPFDIILDTSGIDNICFWHPLVKFNGHLLLLATRFSANLSPIMFKGLSLSVPFIYSPMIDGRGGKEQSEILSLIADYIHRQDIEPIIDINRFDLADLREALNYQASRTRNGKVLINVQ